MKIITISGIDGSGKSTQLKELQKHLEKQNKSVQSFHVVTFSLINNILWKNKKRKERKHKLQQNENLDQTTIFEQPARAITSGNFFTIFARKIILLIDIIRFKFFTRKLQQRKINYLLSDRYFYDQIINILYLSYKKTIIQEIANPQGKKIDIKFSPLLKLSNKLIPQPTNSFFIDIPPKIALERDRDIEQGKEYLVIKRVLYKKFLAQWNIKLINGDNEPNIIQKEILKIINDL
jgi:thymidylate kinase